MRVYVILIVKLYFENTNIAETIIRISKFKKNKAQSHSKSTHAGQDDLLTIKYF